MESNVVVATQKNEDDRTYPCMMYYTGNDATSKEFADAKFVVLFNSEFVGTVVYVKPGYVEWKLGDICSDWVTEAFSPLPDDAAIVLN